MAALIDAGDVTLAKPGQQFSPDVTGLAGGGYALAWITGDNSDLDSPRSSVHVQVYDSSGNPAGTEQVAFVPEQAPVAVRVAPLASGGFMAFWAADQYLGPYVLNDVDFFAQSFDAAGNPTSSAIKVNDHPASGSNLLQPVPLANGGIAVNFGGNTVQLFDASGNAVGADIPVQRDANGAPRAGDEVTTYPARIAPDGQGGFWAVWNAYTSASSSYPNESPVDLAHFDASGNLVPIWNAFTQRAEDVYRPAVGASSVQPSIATLANGNLVVAWPFTNLTNGSTGIHVEMLDANANSFANWNVPQQSGSTGYVQDFKVTPMVDGTFVVSWIGSVNSSTYPTHVYEQHFAAGGGAIGGVEQVGEATTTSSSQFTVFGAAALNDGSILYSWSNGHEDAGDIHLDRLSPTGAGVPGSSDSTGVVPFSASSSNAVTTTAADETGPYTAVLAGGGHVDVWTSGHDAASQVWARFFDAQGNATTGPVQLFADLGGLRGPSADGLAALPDGTIVVTATTLYQSAPGETPEMRAWEERIDANGHVIGAPDLVESKTVADIGNFTAGPVLVMPDGSYAVETISIERPVPPFGGGAYVEIQRYDANGAKSGGLRNIDSGNGFTAPDATVLTNGNILTVSTDLGSRFTTSLGIDVSDASGNLLSSRQVGSSESSAQVERLTIGGAFIAWMHGSNVLPPVWEGMIVDGAGQQVGNAFELPVPAAAAVRLAGLQDGVLLWWNDGAAAMAQYVDANGRSVGDAFSIGNDVASVTGTPDGGFLVERTPATGPGDHDIVEQRYVPASQPQPQPGPTPHGTIDVSGHGGVTPIPAGNFAITGGAGIDQISFASAHTAYNVTPASISGPEGSDTLSGIERVRFGDGMAIAFDVTGDAGEAYRLYQAAFNRAPDLPGLGFHIRDLDSGVPLALVARHFVDSPEFQSRYGAAVDDTQFITLLYENVLHREPEQAGLAFHLDEFAQGQSRPEMLTHFSESPENQANVIGQIGNGMWFVPLA